MKIGKKIQLKQTLTDGTTLHGKIIGIELVQSGYYLSQFSFQSYLKSFDKKRYKIAYENKFCNKVFSEWFDEDEIVR